MTTIFLLSLAGVVISVAVGSFWYSPGTPMGRLHMRHLGFDKLTAEEQKKMIEKAKPTMPKTYVAQMLLSLLTSLATVFIITMSVQNGVPFMMALGFVIANWLCFMVPVNGSQILWGNVDRKIAWQKFFSDILSNLVIILLIALMTSFFI
jgi:biotin synthase-like enzyme